MQREFQLIGQQTVFLKLAVQTLCSGNRGEEEGGGRGGLGGKIKQEKKIEKKGRLVKFHRMGASRLHYSR